MAGEVMLAAAHRPQRRLRGVDLLPVIVSMTYAAVAAFDATGTNYAVAFMVVALAILFVGWTLPLRIMRAAAPVLILLLVLQRLASGIHLPGGLASLVASADDAIMFVASPLAIMVLRDPRLTNWMRTGVMLLLLAPLLGLVGAHLHHIWPAAAYLGLWLTLKPIFAFIIGLGAATDPQTAAQLKRWLGRLGILVGAIGLVELVAPSVVRAVTQPAETVQGRLVRAGVNVVRSLFSGPQEYGIFMVLVGGLLWLWPSRARDKRVGLALLVLSLLSLRLKTVAEFAVLIGCAAVLASRGRRLRTVMSGALVAVAVGVIAGPTLWQIVTAQEALYLAPTSQTPRAELYATGWKIARDYFPLGTGTGSFGSHASIVYRSPIYAQYGLDHAWGFGLNGPVLYALDTSWPVVMAELGILGLVSLLLGGWLCIRRGGRDYVTSTSLRWGLVLVVLIDSIAGARMYDPLALLIVGWVWSMPPEPAPTVATNGGGSSANAASSGCCQSSLERQRPVQPGGRNGMRDGRDATPTEGVAS